MNWRLVFSLGLGVGVVMAALAALGWLAQPALEFGVWGVVALGSALLIGIDAAARDRRSGTTVDAALAREGLPPPSKTAPAAGPPGADPPASGGKPFTTGFLAGVLMGVTQHALVLALWPLFIANNPQYVELMASETPGMDPRIAMVLGIAPISAMWGLVIGLLSWALALFLRARQRAA